MDELVTLPVSSRQCSEEAGIYSIFTLANWQYRILPQELWRRLVVLTADYERIVWKV